MKIKIKLNELINILIDKNQDPLLKKYNLNEDRVIEIQKSLKGGHWKFAN